MHTGPKNQELVEISSGLKAGQTVARDASTDIKENARVKIKSMFDESNSRKMIHY
ncbi:MAG: hypothetical protein PHR04_06685 [Syntrophomonadaceae bacterium]|nr:hypothetical protein [Syntrophomonadaceae bacterium]MDD3271765.1 hypothetical protein [Syntrophomonadaceae bacterium]MDD3897719.1 hypothetical protein [Syntrophomonadaceae bacterium]